MVSNERTCAVAAAVVEEVRLFANLSPMTSLLLPSLGDLATKMKYSYGMLLKLLNDGVVRPSASPWRAQVHAVKDEENRNTTRNWMHTRSLALTTWLTT